MVDAVAFQTRARTIDHLGREQIADVPTAISELWKNAYDAYARDVALHIYEGNPALAMIADDGHGMSKRQFVENWLVVGTESKASGNAVPEVLRQGLSERPKQGQKGIGRLSVAALGSTVLVISKPTDSQFVACLVDWRLFENPYIFLHDIRLPVVEFASPSDLSVLLASMRAGVLENITAESGPDDRTARLRAAWAMFDANETAQDSTTKTTSSLIKVAATTDGAIEESLKDWSVWTGDKPSGTALVMAELNDSLTAWIPRGISPPTEAEESSRASLVRTLSGFSDPYEEGTADALNYRVVIHTKTEAKIVVGREEGFGLPFLQSLDHVLEGDFDVHGVFRGRVKAFGKILGQVDLTPIQPLPQGTRDRIGPFSLIIGAFEPVARSSTLPMDIHARVAARAETHSGLSIYRDGLRVMPYGRPENDFFKIEERRQFHAGREFWASRRLFGRIAISRRSNPNLRDKAGREGLIDNSASRAVQLLVIDLLKTAARRYFGSDSSIRQELLPAIEAENLAAAAVAKKAQSSQLNAFRSSVRAKSAELDVALARVVHATKALQVATERADQSEIWQLGKEIDALVSIRSELRLPPKPKRLGSFEETFRDYRDRYSLMATEVEEVRRAWNAAAAHHEAKPPFEIAQSHLSSNQKALTDQLAKWKRAIETLLRNESKRIEESIDSDSKIFYKTVAPLLLDIQSNQTPLRAVVDEMDQVRDRLSQRFSDFYESYLRALKQLAEGLDLDGALAHVAAYGDTLERRLEQVQALAQVGISVEILSHELHTLDRRLASSLNALPEAVRSSSAFQNADAARRELVERLRFLSQMQIASGDVRQRISGQDIEGYLRHFFGTLLLDQGIDLVATTEFQQAAFYEFPSRIFPVFINLVNNSIYWLAGRSLKEIRLSANNGILMVSDSGPGIDAEDVANLFELFFTRRTRGRGVGLYLCRQTLAAGGHAIEYLLEEEKKVLPGANFAITLRGGFDA